MRRHPHLDENGNIVYIRRPHIPSNEFTWYDHNSVATFTPGSKTPSYFNIKSVIREPYFHEPKYQETPGLRKSAGSIILHNNRAVLISPTNEFGGYRYTFPKGRVDHYEDMRSAATREVAEETGLHSVPFHYLGDFDRSTTRTRMYLSKFSHGNPANMGWESQAVHFVPINKLHNYIHTAVDHDIVDKLQSYLKDK